MPPDTCHSRQLWLSPHRAGAGQAGLTPSPSGGPARRPWRGRWGGRAARGAVPGRGGLWRAGPRPGCEAGPPSPPPAPPGRWSAGGGRWRCSPALGAPVPGREGQKPLGKHQEARHLIRGCVPAQVFKCLCGDDPELLLQQKVSLAKGGLVCMHPQRSMCLIGGQTRQDRS